MKYQNKEKDVVINQDKNFDKILIELNIDANNKIVIIKKHNFSEIHNDSYILFYALVNNYLLADNSFIDECGYSIYYRIFNIRSFYSI